MDWVWTEISSQLLEIHLASGKTKGNGSEIRFVKVFCSSVAEDKTQESSERIFCVIYYCAVMVKLKADAGCPVLKMNIFFLKSVADWSEIN